MVSILAFWSTKISIKKWRSHFINTNVESINKIRILTALVGYVSLLQR